MATGARLQNSFMETVLLSKLNQCFQKQRFFQLWKIMYFISILVHGCQTTNNPHFWCHHTHQLSHFQNFSPLLDGEGSHHRSSFLGHAHCERTCDIVGDMFHDRKAITLLQEENSTRAGSARAMCIYGNISNFIVKRTNKKNYNSKILSSATMQKLLQQYF